MAQRLPVILNDDERKALLKQANKRYITGHRNKVMMQIMFNLGLRLAEVINLKWDDIDFLSEVLMIREGKGMNAYSGAFGQLIRSHPATQSGWIRPPREVF